MQKSMQAVGINYYKLFSKWFPYGLRSLIMSPTVMWMYIGIYSRYFADDYVTAYALSDWGFWKVQVYWYLNWNGSYLYTFLTSLIELRGVSLVPWLPAISILIWVSLLFYLLRTLFLNLGIYINGVWFLFLSNVIFFGTVKSFQDYTQLLYWLTGIIAYQIIISIFILIAIYFIKRFFGSSAFSIQIWEYIALGVTFFIVGGLSETGIVLQCTLFASWILSLRFIRGHSTKHELQKMLIVGLFASVLSLFVTVIAPGGRNHSDVFDILSFDLFYVSLTNSFFDVLNYLFEWISDHTLLVALLSLAGLFVGKNIQQARNKKEKTLFVNLSIYIIVIALIMLWAAFFTYHLAFRGFSPPDRVIFIPMFLLILGYVLLFLFIGFLLNSFRSGYLGKSIEIFTLISLAFLIFILPVRTTHSLLELVPSFRLYAQLWDERDDYLRQMSEQGEKDVMVQCFKRHQDLRDLRPTIWIVGDFEEDSNDWKNSGAAQYYGLNSIGCLKKKK